MYLGQFGDFLRTLLETEKESIIESEYIIRVLYHF